MRPAFIECTNGNPSGFVARVSDFLEKERPFPVGLRYTGTAAEGSPSFVVELVLAPAESTVPIYYAIPPGPPRRKMLPRAALPEFLATALGTEICPPHEAKPAATPPAPRSGRPPRITLPAPAKVGETFSLF